MGEYQQAAADAAHAGNVSTCKLLKRGLDTRKRVLDALERSNATDTPVYANLKAQYEEKLKAYNDRGCSNYESEY